MAIHVCNISNMNSKHEMIMRCSVLSLVALIVIQCYFISLATALGRGVYFARDASYSARDIYTPRDVNGHKYMYYARVLTGQYTLGNSALLVPPPKDPSNPSVLHESVVDDMQNPHIFVVFQDAHVYPEYLIVFH